MVQLVGIDLDVCRYVLQPVRHAGYPDQLCVHGVQQRNTLHRVSIPPSNVVLAFLFVSFAHVYVGHFIRSGHALPVFTARRYASSVYAVSTSVTSRVLSKRTNEWGCFSFGSFFRSIAYTVL